MRINYEGQEYELTELVEPTNGASFDIIAIFKVVYRKWDQETLRFIDYEKDENDDDIEDFLEFVDYFYGASDNKDLLIEDTQWRLEILKKMNKI